MIIKKNIDFIDHLFQILCVMAKNKNLAINLRIKIIGTLSESAMNYYKNCDEIINILYSELTEILENESENTSLQIEAVMILFLIFKRYKKLPKDKLCIKNDVMKRCLKIAHDVLECKHDDIHGWLSSLSFLIFMKEHDIQAISDAVFHERFCEKLIDIAENVEHKISDRLYALGLLLDFINSKKEKLNKKNQEKYFDSDVRAFRLIAKSFEVLYSLADHEELSFLDRLSAVGYIINYLVLKKSDLHDNIDKYFDMLFNVVYDVIYDDTIDSKIWMKSLELFFRISGNTLRHLDNHLGPKCVENTLRIAADNNESYVVRLEAAKFIMGNFSKNAFGVKIGDTAVLSLAEIIKTEQFLSEDYLEVLRLYLSMIARGFSKRACLDLSSKSSVTQDKFFI